MTKTAIILAMILYAVIAIGHYRQKDYPHFLIWLCYAGSLVGFYWDAILKERLP